MTAPTSGPSLLRRTLAWFLPAALLLAACSANAEPAAEPAERAEVVVEPPADVPEDPPEPSVSTPPPPEDCRHDRLERHPVVLLTGSDAVTLSRRVAERTHRCVPVAVVAPIGSWSSTLAVPVAIAEDAPLLLVDPDEPAPVQEALDQLAVDEVITVGVRLDVVDHPGTELLAEPRPGPEDEFDDVAPPQRDDEAEEPEPVDPPTEEQLRTEHDVKLALAVAHHLGTRRFLAVREDDVRSRTAAALLADASVALLPVPVDSGQVASLAESLPTSARLQVVGGTTARGLAEELLSVGVDAAVADGDRWPEGASTSWLVDPDQPDAGAVAAVAAAGRDEALLPIDGSDLRANAANAVRVRNAAPDRTVLVGEVTADALWQLDVVLDGPALPGGGFRLFEDERLVALYGSPTHTALGALGEQDLDATVERLREVAEPYATDGMRVLPAFEIIVTVASASPGPEADYSARTDIEVLRPYIDRAAEEGFYVILDLQPGRTDFLDQAKEYEELLLEPHVGLALDPEWRLGPDEVHLRRIGSVEVEEVQRVADWLAELTRHHSLPQKLLLLHQFTFGMLPDRDDLEVPAELAVVVHMDGQGALGTKYETYAAITRGAEERWTWGWKNFYDEDQPLATPEQVLDLEPVPMVVTYQ